MHRNTPVMRAAAVWYEVVGGSETAEAPNWYDYALRDRRELCVHDGALRERFLMLLSRMDTPVRARRVGYIDVTVRGSKKFRGLPVTLEEFDQIWSSISGR